MIGRVNKTEPVKLTRVEDDRRRLPMVSREDMSIATGINQMRGVSKEIEVVVETRALHSQ